MAPSLSQCGSISLAGAPMHETLPHLHVSTVVRAAAAAVSGISGSQERAYKKLYAKLKHQKQVKIVALGGSMLVGMGCRDLNVSAWASGPSRACSYPDRFANLLHDAHYSEENGSNVFYVNRATGGTTTAAALPMMDSLLTTDVEAPTAEHPDLLLIDYSVNDQDLEQDAVHFGQDTRVTSATSGFTKYDEVYAANEQMLRHLSARAPDTAILIVEGSCVAMVCAKPGMDIAGGCIRRSKQLVTEADPSGEMSASRATKDAAMNYGVPYLPYPKLVSTCLNYGLVNHPGASAHKQIAGACYIWLCAFISRLVDDTPPVGSHPALLERYAVCPKPRSLFDARSSVQLQGSDRPLGRWILGEDRPGKPGWMPQRAGDTIVFPLSFGMKPSITIVYTQGYTAEWGDVAVAMSTGLQNFSLSAKHAERTTISTSLVLNVRQDVIQDYDGGIKGFGILPGSNATLRLTSRSGKFKVSLVSSC